ncbi:hypothetical protein EDD15DRAFT_2368210 [Pisolithus albus]|nr:hypothetical protein EDD15DRAFT_2368210 [Pisolithus albus]
MVLLSGKASKQREATTRWLNKPGVLEAQQEKARLRAARNRERKKAADLEEVNTRSDGTIDHIPDQCDPNDDSQTSSSLGRSSMASPAPTLPEMRLSIDEWRSDWGPEGGWLKRFDESLRKACEKGLASTDCFFKECEIHAREGRSFLHIL